MKAAGNRMALTSAREWTGASDGRRYRREEWSLVGGEIDPAWLERDARFHDRLDGWEPSCRFTLYVLDGEVDPRLASYGGAVWPTAWPQLFEPRRVGTYAAGVDITDAGLMLRAAALDGASCADVDARLLP